MAKIEITCVVKAKDGSIESVRATDDREFSRQEVLDALKRGDEVWTKPPTGSGAQVHGVAGEDRKYLSTDPNDTTRDNLDGLRECPQSDSLKKWAEQPIAPGVVPPLAGSLDPPKTTGSGPDGRGSKG